MKYFIVKRSGGLMGQTRKVRASRGAIIELGPFNTLEDARAARGSTARLAYITTAIASRALPTARLKWEEGDPWMLTDKQREKLSKK